MARDTTVTLFNMTSYYAKLGTFFKDDILPFSYKDNYVYCHLAELKPRLMSAVSTYNPQQLDSFLFEVPFSGVYILGDPPSQEK
jgi:hypothetical protein